MGKALIIINSFLVGAILSGFLARQLPEYFMPNLDRALQECLSEVEKGCPMLLGYAKSLESENARLNRVLKTQCLCAEPATH